MILTSALNLWPNASRWLVALWVLRMKWRSRILWVIVPALAAGWMAGCAGVEHRVAVLGPLQEPASIARTGDSAIRLAGAETIAPSSEDVFLHLQELTEDAVIEQTLARNPSLAQMAAAWEAAQARYPQAIAWDDPMATGIIGPASIGSRDVDTAYRLEIGQKIQFPGKRFWRGQNALAEAGAAQSDLEAMRLELMEAARNAYFEYSLVQRLLTVNAESARRLKELKDSADFSVRTGLSPQQDILQAVVELGRQRERLLELEQMSKVATARINTLVRRDVETALPPPTALMATFAPLPSVAELRQHAQQYRPDLQAIAQRMQADEANVMVALKERCPDVELMAAYDAFWQSPERDLRPMLGLRMNLPVVAGRRQGMIQEAQAKIAQRRAEFMKLLDQVNFQVQEAHAQVERGRKTVKLYEDSILKAAEAHIKEAQTAYSTGKIPFLSLIEAQRNLIMLRERYYESITNLHRAEAALDRAVGADFLDE